MKLARFAGVFTCAVAAVTVVVTVLSLVLSARANELTGLVRQVYPETGFAGAPVLDGISPDVDLGFLDEDPTLPQRFFSAPLHGFCYLPKGAAVELHGAGDDRLDVRVDGALVIRRAPPTEMHTQVAALELGAGLHEVVVEYEQHGGVYNLRLEWAPQNGSPRPFPPHFLFHAPAASHPHDRNEIPESQRALHDPDIVGFGRRLNDDPSQPLDFKRVLRVLTVHSIYGMAPTYSAPCVVSRTLSTR